MLEDYENTGAEKDAGKREGEEAENDNWIVQDEVNERKAEK